MPRYRSRPARAWFDHPADVAGASEPSRIAPTVFEQPTFTGLLDAAGNQIWTYPDPVGFLSFGDDD